MQTIQSFTVNHDKLKPGMYLSRIDGDCVPYDIRMVTPNAGIYLENDGLHTFEHLFATYVRNTPFSDRIIYVGPMGCRTAGSTSLPGTRSPKRTPSGWCRKPVRSSSPLKGRSPAANAGSAATTSTTPSRRPRLTRKTSGRHWRAGRRNRCGTKHNARIPGEGSAVEMEQKSKAVYWVWLSLCFPVACERVVALLEETDPETFYRGKDGLLPFLKPDDLKAVETVSLERAEMVIRKCEKAE